jgi:hypothetical protein
MENQIIKEDHWNIPVILESWGIYKLPKSRYPNLEDALKEVLDTDNLGLQELQNYQEDSTEVDWEGILTLNPGMQKHEVDEAIQGYRSCYSLDCDID